MASAKGRTKLYSGNLTTKAAHAGKVSAEQARAKAELEYDRYRQLADAQPRPVDEAFEQAVKQLPKPTPQPRRKKPTKAAEMPSAPGGAQT